MCSKMARKVNALLKGGVYDIVLGLLFTLINVLVMYSTDFFEYPEALVVGIIICLIPLYYFFSGTYRLTLGFLGWLRMMGNNPSTSS